MSNNISKEYVSFAKKNIYEYLKIIMNKKFKKDIADILVEEYMSVRYYNYFEIKHKNSVTNINYYLKNKAMLRTLIWHLSTYYILILF